MRAAKTSNRLIRRVQFTNQAGESPLKMLQTFAHGISLDTTGPTGFVGSGRKLVFEDEPTPVMGIPVLNDTKS
jgi:hypothetical protein